MIAVTRHAIERYQERVADLPDDQVEALLSSPAIQTAAQIGARFVRLSGGQRVVLCGSTVVTVQPSTHYRRQIHRTGLGRYGKSQRPRCDEAYKGELD